MAGTLNDIYTYNFNGITIPYSKDYPSIDWDFQFLSQGVVQETIKFYYPNKWGDGGGVINNGKLSLKLKNGSSISEISAFTANQADNTDFIIESGNNVSIDESNNKITINANNTEYVFEQVDNTLKAGIAGDVKTDIYTPILTKGDKGDAANWFTGTINPTSVPDSLNGDMYLNTDNYNVYRREDVGTTETWVYKCNIKGTPGINGTDGTDGVGISSIIKTSTSGLVDTYTITYTNGNSTTFTVTNGQNGTDGTDGTDGKSLEFQWGTDANLYKLGVKQEGQTSYMYSQSLKGNPGDAATVTVGTTTTGNPGTNASVTNSGTTSAAVLNFTIPKGADGAPGTDGADGTSAYWFTGTVVNGTGTGISAVVANSKAGDMYLNTSTYNVYSATAPDTWNYVCNIKGSSGGDAKGYVWNEVYNSFAEGEPSSSADTTQPTSTGVRSHAEGYGTTSTGDGAHAEGYANGGTISSDGMGALAGGKATNSSEIDSTSDGSISYGCADNGGNIISEDSGAVVVGYASGYGTYLESDDYGAFVNGCVEVDNTGVTDYTQILAAKGAHGEGYVLNGGIINASGDGSHAQGKAINGGEIQADSTVGVSNLNYQSDIDSPGGSHAEGFTDGGTISASGTGSHAEGYAENGEIIEASGTGSHAEGRATVASGDYAHAGGFGTVANEWCNTSIGKFNKNAEHGDLFIIGNGTGNNNRSNALTVNDKGLITVDNRGGLKLTSGGSTDKVWNTNGTITDLSGLTPTGAVTGSGTSGNLAKWTSSNSIGDGPAIDTSDTNTFLRHDGTWQTISAGTDEKVKQTSNTDTGYKPILTATSTSPISGNAAEAQYDTTVGIQHSTGYIQANSVRIDDYVYATFQHNTSTNYAKFEAAATDAYLELIDDNSSADTITVNLKADDAYITMSDDENNSLQTVDIYADGTHISLYDTNYETQKIDLYADDAYIGIYDIDSRDEPGRTYNKQQVIMRADDACIEIIDENGEGGVDEKINIECHDTRIVLNDATQDIDMYNEYTHVYLNGSSELVRLRADGTYLEVDDSNGSVNITGDTYCTGAYYASSDARKKDVVDSIPLDKAYELVEKCQTIFYTWKNDEDKHREIGLLAQEVRQYFPELVSEGKDGYLTLEYSRLVVILMAVIKDLTKKVNTLSSIEERLKALENKVG